MKRLLYLIVGFTLFTVSSFAQLTVQVEAPRAVAVGEAFRVEFSLNDKPDNFTPPSFANFNLVAGPSISESVGVSVINGKMTRQAKYTYSYVLVAQNKGNFTIAAAEATLKNKSYKSKPLPVEVVDEGGSASSGAASSGAREQRNETRTSTSAGKDDVILLMEVDKKNVYKGEAISAKIKLLTRSQLVAIEGNKVPSFAGFWKQELNEERSTADWTRITYNNKVYDAAVMKEFLLFPQQNGAITIDPMTLNIVVRIESEEDNSAFGGLFGRGVSYKDVRRVISSKPITVNVKPYPGAEPKSFGGAVGDFTMQAALSSDMISANSASNLIVTIRGNGNLPLVTEPTATLPESFELYKIKSEESINVTANGVDGQKMFTYPFIARAQGDYELSPIEFTYFSPSKNQFITLRSEPFRVSVAADNSGSGGGSETIISGVTKEELKILGSDIGYIMTAAPSLVAKNRFFIGSIGYLLTMIGLAVICFVLLVLLRKMIQEAKDTVKVKSKRANKVALSRLKEAKQHLDGSNSASFYDAVLKAMWGYVADKLNIDKASLSRENVGEKLLERGVREEDKDRFLSVVASCEEARYSPVASSMMGEVYQTAIDVITIFENKL